jgi:hypothetical protein
MNLQEILNYRNKCLICQREMVLGYTGTPKLKVSNTTKGLRISSSHKDGIKFLLNPDGTYQRGERWYDIYDSCMILLTKSCPVCYSSIYPPNSLNSKNPVIIMKLRSVGATSMAGAVNSYFQSGGAFFDSIKKQSCFYSFTVDMDGQSNYQTTLTMECIRYCDSVQFWHANTDFSKGTTLYNAEFTDKLEDMLSLHLPIVNMSNIKDTDEFVNKFKIYSLFS